MLLEQSSTIVSRLLRWLAFISISISMARDIPAVTIERRITINNPMSPAITVFPNALSRFKLNKPVRCTVIRE